MHLPRLIDLRRAMRASDLAFLRLKRVSADAFTPRMDGLERMFLIEYSGELARSEAKDGDTVLCFTDETYLMSGHARVMSWCDPNSKTGARIGVGSSAGHRISVLHAFTKYGLLSAKDQGQFVKPPPTPDLSDRKTTYQTAALLYVGRDTMDYHKNFDADMYEWWIRQMFIPAFKALHPGKRCVLVLDNASYHKAVPADVKPATTKAALIAEILRLTGGKVVRVCSDSNRIVEFTAAKAALRSTDGGASIKQLMLAARVWRRFLPPLNPDLRIERAFAEWSAEENRTVDNLNRLPHRLLYTPPGQSHLQPIELLWGVTKNAVAQHFYQSRDVEAARKQLLTEFQRTTSGLCERIIEHVHREMDISILNHKPFLKGTIRSLQVDVERSSAELERAVHDAIVAEHIRACKAKDQNAAAPSPPTDPCYLAAQAEITGQPTAPLPPLNLNYLMFLSTGVDPTL